MGGKNCTRGSESPRRTRAGSRQVASGAQDGAGSHTVDMRTGPYHCCTARPFGEEGMREGGGTFESLIDGHCYAAGRAPALKGETGSRGCGGCRGICMGAAGQGLGADG